MLSSTKAEKKNDNFQKFQVSIDFFVKQAGREGRTRREDKNHRGRGSHSLGGEGCIVSLQGPAWAFRTFLWKAYPLVL